MSELVNLNINGKSIQAKEGDSLLNVARANDIFIPALCYLSRCSPTLACRLCLVEADGKQVYSCNAKVKKDMQVNTSTANIEKERRAIMEVYDVNHPLQCGVCDQSGECELQNYSLYMKIDKQHYAIKDVPRPTQHWGVMNYDPGLCIVCEKCVTVCKDMIGSSALSTVKRGADPIIKDFKETMPKDAYSMWNKLNKSLIGFNADACTDCGECISVCPVGALVSHDFQYKSNSWELTRIPASNPHSSDCALMYYETKHESIENHKVNKIYRVTNDHHYSTLNGAARFAYDFENKIDSKDEIAFEKAITAFKKADTIKFNSFITNEEALILQKIKEKTGVKLVNNDAFLYKKFLESYSQISKKSLYDITLDDIHESNFVISLGSFLKTDLPHARYALNNAVVTNKGASLYFHCVKDPIIESIGKKGKTTQTIYHKPLKEEFVLYFLLELFAKDLPVYLQTHIDSFKETRTKTVVESKKEKVIEKTIDPETGEEKETSKIITVKTSNEVEYTYSLLLDEINADEKVLETIEAMLAKKDKFTIIVGEDFISHPNALLLAKLLATLEKHSEFNILIIPTSTNTLGVSLICDLDEKEEGYVVSYNEASDFQLSALGDGDLDMPALNQQEGTFTNINKRVVPTNAALEYSGYVLNDIANVILEDEVEHTIEYTKYLPINKSYQSIEFDDLENYFSNDYKENRGYVLNSFDVNEDLEINLSQSFSLNKKENEVIIYRANPMNQFNEFTAKAHQNKENEQSGVFASAAFLKANDLENEDNIIIEANNIKIETKIFLDNQIDGEIVYVSTFDKDLNTKALFSTYRYNTAQIIKV
ncbi:MAG: NADH-quinone oxidoreductase subunit G [Campylobacteraceae bacterium]|nr:NADH-quinone oxidoreductase subunit G [Campylobacteraceae bacterium]